MYDKIFDVIQFVLSALMFGCVAAGVAGHAAKGHIDSVAAAAVCLVFTVLAALLLRAAWRELRRKD